MPELEEKEDEDTRWPEEHMADAAAATLDRLAAMRCELWSLHRQLLLLGGYTYNTDTGQKLLGLSRDARMLASDEVCEIVRDVAATLPKRG